MAQMDHGQSVSLTAGLDKYGKATEEDRKKAVASGDVAKYQKFLST